MSDGKIIIIGTRAITIGTRAIIIGTRAIIIGTRTNVPSKRMVDVRAMRVALCKHYGDLSKIFRSS